MSSAVQTCPDLHKCRNGAKCQENPFKEGSFVCDCSNIVSSTSVFAGLACEHEATIFCNTDNELSHSSFCTNGGTCVKKNDINDDDTHHGCKCGSNYRGDFCEFIAGQTVPENWPSSIASTDYSGSPSTLLSSAPSSSNDNVGAVVGSIVGAIVLMLLLLIGMMWYRKHRFAEPHEVNNKSMSDLNIDPDGDTLRGGEDNLNNVTTSRVVTPRTSGSRTPSPKNNHNFSIDEDDLVDDNNYMDQDHEEGIDRIHGNNRMKQSEDDDLEDESIEPTDVV